MFLCVLRVKVPVMTFLKPFCTMTSRRAARFIRSNPFTEAKFNRKQNMKPKKVMNESILEINTESESELLMSDSEKKQNTDAGHSQFRLSSTTSEPTMQLAKNEMLSLLKEIRDSQSSLCTKNDLLEHGHEITKKFNDIDRRVSANTSSFSGMSSRINKIESTLERNKHETELAKQSVISRNITIIGIPPMENEDLGALAIKVSSLVGCELSRSDMFGSYRVKMVNSSTNIIIVKLNDFSLKHRILKSKGSKEIRLNDVVGSGNSGDNPLVFVNNHVTPFFGKLLAEGRRAVKDRKIHSVWLNKDGCRLRFDEKGKEHVYRNIEELNALISARQKSSTRGASNKRTRANDDHISPNSIHKAKK